MLQSKDQLLGTEPIHTHLTAYSVVEAAHVIVSQPDSGGQLRHSKSRCGDRCNHLHTTHIVTLLPVVQKFLLDNHHISTCHSIQQHIQDKRWHRLAGAQSSLTNK